MKRFMALGLCFVFVLSLAGCATNKTRVAEGAGIGGVLGGVAGGVIGNQSGHSVGGGLIGAAVGAAAGALVGSQIEKNKPAAEAAAISTLSMKNIVDMTQQKISSDDIIAKIRSTNTKLVLTAEDISYLQKEDVSERVIEALQGK
ncbi:MAG: glycine zipper 2TM domain-containing protein [Candidatus Omnitrophota bacterium]